jgi:hypothetical protein
MQMLHLQQLQIAQQMHQQRLQQSVALQPQTSPVIQQQQMVMNQQVRFHNNLLVPMTQKFSPNV